MRSSIKTHDYIFLLFEHVVQSSNMLYEKNILRFSFRQHHDASATVGFMHTNVKQDPKYNAKYAI